MQQITKLFADQLNQLLDELGLPANVRERAAVFGKMLDISKQQAWSLLEGHIMPDETLLQRIATELEVDVETLLAKKE